MKILLSYRQMLIGKLAFILFCYIGCRHQEKISWHPGIATKLDSGGQHACVVTRKGAIKCWGENEAGQLGNGTFKSSEIPVDVLGFSTNAVQVSTGAIHTCGLSSNGIVKCWGGNFFGQLGDGGTSDMNMAVEVKGLGHDIVAISAGYEHNCALDSQGKSFCWGNNIKGQLGNGHKSDNNIPMAVVGVVGLTERLSSISAGFRFTCAIASSGGVLCWGANEFGQLGNGTNIYSSLPVKVSGLSSEIISITSGYSHACAVKSSGKLVCWGSGLEGQLCNGTNKGTKLPIEVIGLDDAVKNVSASPTFTCASTITGGTKCWGNMGTGRFRSSTPLDVFGLASEVAFISTGYRHACVLSKLGSVKCWGEMGNVGWIKYLQGKRAIFKSKWPKDVPGLEN